MSLFTLIHDILFHELVGPHVPSCNAHLHFLTLKNGSVHFLKDNRLG